MLNTYFAVSDTEVLTPPTTMNLVGSLHVTNIMMKNAKLNKITAILKYHLK